VKARNLATLRCYGSSFTERCDAFGSESLFALRVREMSHRRAVYICGSWPQIWRSPPPFYPLDFPGIYRNTSLVWAIHSMKPISTKE
jgi:hypothetical protein